MPELRDLCTLADVTSYVPAYEANEMTDAKLAQLITAESLLIAEESGREIIGPADVVTRTFEISVTEARLRKIPIGDLDGLYDDVVSILNPDGSVSQVVDADSIVALYDGQRSPTREWEPITELYFPWGLPHTPVLLAQWQVLEVVGRWGFPEVPAFVREACAARVIVRYLSEIASAGTDFAQAVSESGLNIQALYQTAQDAIDSLSGGVVMA